MVYDSSDFTVFYSNQQMLSFLQKIQYIKKYIYFFISGRWKHIICPAQECDYI
jgi:hypothetical protein